MIYHEGYTYRQDSINKKTNAKDQTLYWRCRIKTCKARGKTDEKRNFFIIRPKHSHQPDSSEDFSSELKEVVSCKR